MQREDLQKKILLQEALFRIYKSQDVQEYLLPILSEAISNKHWVDPTDPEFEVKYKDAYYRTKIYKEILNIFSNSEEAIKALRAELNKPVKSYGIK